MTNSRRFAFVNVLLLTVVVIVGSLVYLQTTHAALQISGRIYDSRTGKGYAGKTVQGPGVQATTDANGSYALILSGNGDAASGGFYVHLNPSQYPAGVSGPVLGNQPEHSNATGYDYQVAGASCYHVVSALCPAPGPGSEWFYWDKASESNYDFAFTSPMPTPTPMPPPVVTPAPAPTPAPTPPAAADTTAPSVPKSFAASLAPGSTGVQLHWDAATDEVGVKGYFLERSTDQQKWDALTDPATFASTTYLDTATKYNVHYFYRVRALDAANNQSDPATAEVTTSTFAPNAGQGSAATVTSDDGVVTVTIPAATTTTDISCNIVSDSSNADALGGTHKILASGPYSLVCKDSSGKSLDQYGADLTVSVSTTSKKFSQLTNLQFFNFDPGVLAWVSMKTSTNTKSKTITVTTRNPVEIVVMGTTKPGISANLIALIVIIVLVILVLLSIRGRRIKKHQYNEYIRRKYYNY